MHSDARIYALLLPNFLSSSRVKVQVLNRFTVDVSSGQTLALVGASGCGKSTIIKLMERFYNPTSGGIFFDDNSIVELNLEWLRSQIGLVSQVRED